MIVREILHTCANPHVARAAIASIGGEFAARFARAASRRDLQSGAFASRCVRAFPREAQEQDWDDVEEAIRGAEMPVLAGLRLILERALLRDVARGMSEASTPPAWAIRSATASAWGD